MAGDVLELFSGMGGFSAGLAMHGIRSTGYERWPQAARVAVGNGHRVIVADVAATTPRGDWQGIAAGPPCQGFTAAGNGEGRKDFEMLLCTATEMADRPRLATTILGRAAMNAYDHRSALALEPWRWWLLLECDWLILEQVPEVGPLWDHLAWLARRMGFGAWTGNVQAEQFDVPQTRRRRVLAIHRFRADEKLAPIPVMSRFHPRDPAKLDRGLARWKTIGQALAGELLDDQHYALGDVRRPRGAVRTRNQPAPTVMAGHDNGNYRWLVSNYGTGGDAAIRGRRSLQQPAATITSKAGRNKWSDGGRLTTRQAAALQGFEPGLALSGNLTDQYTMIGNAVPPPLAFHLFDRVLG